MASGIVGRTSENYFTQDGDDYTWAGVFMIKHRVPYFHGASC
jgi:hypothetical protein